MEEDRQKADNAHENEKAALKSALEEERRHESEELAKKDADMKAL